MRTPVVSGHRHGGAIRLFTAAIIGAAMLVLGVRPASAQHVDVTGFGGYLWGGTVNVQGGDLHANANAEYGGVLSAEIRPGYYGELQYWYQGTDLLLRLRGNDDAKVGNLGAHYILLCGTRDLRYDDTGVMPFVTGGMGITVYSLSDAPPTVSGGTTVACFMLGGGFKLDLNEKLAIRSQVRLLLPTRLWSSGVWFGTGGAGYGVSGTSIAQGDANLGLTLKLGS